MCCIIYKPKGVEMPAISVLNRIRAINRDGCGFVSTAHKCKSMDYDVFLHHLSGVGIDEDCIIHFRLATHGSVCRGNCHPFNENGVYFAHNGILGIRPDGNMTDSETAFRTIIYPAIERYGYGAKEADRIIESIIGYSKFALMYKGDVKLYGEYANVDGVYYSNLRWIF